MNSEQLDTLLARLVDETITPEELAVLEARLASDEAACRHYVRYLDLHHELQAQAMRSASVVQPTTTGRVPRFLWLRPLTAAAAGLVIGLFSASMVWAYVVPRGARVPLKVVNRSFENVRAMTRAEAADQADVWFGADMHIVETGAGLPTPKSGRHMLRLGPMTGEVPSLASLMLHLDEVRPAEVEGLQLEISAWFHASTSGSREHYTLRAATFAEQPKAVAAITAARGVSQGEWRSLQDEAISMSGLGLTCGPEQTGWQRVRIRLEAPPQARTLLIRLLANTPGPPQGRTAHFIDDVQAAWIIPPANTAPLP